MSTALKYRFELLLLTAVLTLSAPDAKSASCHGGGGGQSLTSLSAEQAFQLGISSNYRTVLGFFDPYGDYSGNPDGASSTSKTMVLGASFRLREELQGALSLPVIVLDRAYRNSQMSSTGAGDPVLEAKYTVWDDIGFLPFRPQLDITGGLRLPVARSVYNSSNPNEVFGDGLWTAHVGISGSKRRGFLKVGLDGTFFYPFLKNVTQMGGELLRQAQAFKSGNRLQIQESLTFLISHRWSAGLNFKQFWQLGAERDDFALPGSASRLFSSGANLSFAPNPWVSVSAAFETVAPFYRYLANQPNFQSLSLTATYSGY